MLIYIAIFLYLITITYIYDYRNDRRYLKLNYVISCIILIAVAGLRYRIGYDTNNYMDSFESAIPLSEIIDGRQFKGDPLWMYINGLAKEIYNDFFVVQIIQAIIVNGAVFWFIRRHSPKPFLAVLLYFLLLWWNLCFEAMREAIAVAFFLFALDGLLLNKGFIIYYLRIWPAIFAHSFGFVTLIFPFIKFLKIKKYAIIYIVAIVVLSYFVKDYLNNLSVLFEMTSEMASDKATKYLESDTYGENNLSISGIISMFIGSILPCIPIIASLKNKTILGKTNLIPFVFIYICIVIIRIQIPIFFRFLNYFELLVIVAFTQAIYLERKKIRVQLAYISMALMVLVRMYSLTAYDVGTKVRAYHRYVPYNSIFQRNYNKESETIFNSNNT